MKHDITSRIGPLYGRIGERAAEYPMYSYERPAYLLWNAIYNQLRAQKWTHKQAIDWLQSKNPRWSLDNTLGDMIEKIGTEFAKGITK